MRKSLLQKKAFLATGISNALGGDEDRMIRDDAVCEEIEAIMKAVFGYEVMGFMEPSDTSDVGSESDGDDPFAICDSELSDVD